MEPTTQSAHPWRATVRTVFAAVVALAAGAPLLYTAIFNDDPATATGGLAVVLAVAGAITRVMALPFVEDFLRRFVPWLAAGRDDSDGEPTATNAGERMTNGVRESGAATAEDHDAPEQPSFFTSDPAKRGEPGAIWLGEQRTPGKHVASQPQNDGERDN